MSLDSDFQSDESDYEAENSLSERKKEEDEELALMYINLTCFQHIYNNNAIIDMEVGLIIIYH